MINDQSLKTQPFTHLKLTIFPDGGVMRLRAFGTMAPQSKL